METRYIKIQLLDATFWGIHDLGLFLSDPDDFSPLIDLKTLEKYFYGIIKEAYRNRRISVFDMDGNKIDIPDSLEEISPDLIDISDSDIIDEEEFNVQCVTIKDSDSKTNVPEPSIEDYEKANMVLSKNGNTVKKAIKKMLLSNESKFLLIAMKEIEENNKGRIGVINEISKKFGEIDD